MIEPFTPRLWAQSVMSHVEDCGMDNPTILFGMDAAIPERHREAMLFDIKTASNRPFWNYTSFNLDPLVSHVVKGATNVVLTRGLCARDRRKVPPSYAMHADHLFIIGIEKRWTRIGFQWGLLGSEYTVRERKCRAMSPRLVLKFDPSFFERNIHPIVEQASAHVALDVWDMI